MAEQSFYELQDVDEVARMREVRRELEEAHPSVDEFDKWLTRLQNQYDRRQNRGTKTRRAATR